VPVLAHILELFYLATLNYSFLDSILAKVNFMECNAQIMYYWMSFDKYTLATAISRWKEHFYQYRKVSHIHFWPFPTPFHPTTGKQWTDFCHQAYLLFRVFLKFCYFIFVVPGTEPRASYVVDIHSAIPLALENVLKIYNFFAGAITQW
jgi:hypothetical protein